MLLFTIIIFGLLGGLVNAIRNNVEIENYWKSLIKGLVAAFLVPVFLEIVKSELGRNLEDELYDYIVLGGMCLVAAIFSDKFIDSIGQQILYKAEEAERKAEESNKKVDTVIDKRAEPDEDEVPVRQRILNFKEFTESKNNAAVKKILKALEDDKYEYRSVNGIVKETSLPLKQYLKFLKTLKQKVLLQVFTQTKGHCGH